MSIMFDPFLAKLKETPYQNYLRTRGYNIFRYKYGPAFDEFIAADNRSNSEYDRAKSDEDRATNWRLTPPDRPFMPLGSDIHRGADARTVYGTPPPAPVATPVVEPELTPEEKRHAMLSRFSDDLRQAPSQLEQVRARRRQLSDPNASDYEPVRDNDGRSWLNKLGSIGREFLVAAGKNYDNSDPRLRPTERLMGSIGAGIGGSAYEGFAGTADEARRRVSDINRLTRQEAELLAQQKFDQDALDSRIKNAKDLNALAVDQAVPVVDPLTGKTVYVDGESAYTQGLTTVRQQVGIDAVDERDRLNRTSRETQSTLNRENALAIAKAAAVTNSDRFNIENTISAEENYLKRKDSWLQRRQNISTEIAKAAAGVGANAGMVNQYVAVIGRNIDMARTLQIQADNESNPRKKQQLEQQVADYMKRVDADTIKMQMEVGRSEQGAALIKQLGVMDDPMPTRQRIPTLTPTLPQGRKPVSSNRDPLGLFSR